MVRIQIIRAGEAAVTDQLAEMRDWLREEGIKPIALEPDRIVGAVVSFRAIFDRAEDAGRFCRQFDEAAHEVA